MGEEGKGTLTTPQEWHAMKNGVRRRKGVRERKNRVWEDLWWRGKRKSMLPLFSAFLVESGHTYANLTGNLAAQ